MTRSPGVLRTHEALTRTVLSTLAAILGAVPFAVIPGVGPAVLVLAVFAWIAVLTRPIGAIRSHAIEVMIALLLAVSFVSMAFGANGLRDVLEFVKWAVAVSVVLLLMRLSTTELRRFGVAYACGATVGGGVSLLLLIFDKYGLVLSLMKPVGYGVLGTIGTTQRYFQVGDRWVGRLAGFYVDPNIAGIFLFLGLALSIALMRRWTRVVCASIISISLVASLSRSAIFAVAVSALIFVVVQKLRPAVRIGILLGGAISLAAALTVPAVRSRFFGSFGAGDRGTSDRAEALQNFVPSMSGHWWFGHGWGAKELIDEVAGYQTNYVANSPLLTIYRGGIVVGIVFVVLLAVGVVAGVRSMRSVPWERGVIGAAFIGFTLVALQLDFPVVTNAPATMMFSVMLVMLARLPVRTDDAVGSVPHPPARTVHG